MKSFTVFALAAVLAPAAFAQHQTFVVNPDASEVKIDAQHDPRGRQRHFSRSIRID